MWQRSHLHSSKTEGSLEKGKAKTSKDHLRTSQDKRNQQLSLLPEVVVFLPLWILYRVNMQDFTPEMELHWLSDIVTITL